MSGSLAVAVTFLDGTPSAGTEVTLAGMLNRVGVTGAATGGPASTAFFDDLPAGDYLVTLSSLDHELVEPRPPVIAPVRDGMTTTVAVTMGPTPAAPPEPGTIRGVVAAAATDEPIRCAIVALDGVSRLTTFGEFAYVAVSPGDHQVAASAPGFVGSVTTVRVMSGETTELRLQLESVAGAVAVEPGGGGAVPTTTAAPAAPSLLPLLAIGVSLAALAVNVSR